MKITYTCSETGSAMNSRNQLEHKTSSVDVLTHTILPTLRSAFLAAGILSGGHISASADNGLREHARVPQSCQLTNVGEKCSIDLARQLDDLSSYALSKRWDAELPAFDKTKPKSERCALTLTWLNRNIERLLHVAQYVEERYPDRNRRVKIYPQNIRVILPKLKGLNADPSKRIEKCTWVARTIYWLSQTTIEKMVIEDIQDMITRIKGGLGKTQGEAERAGKAYLEMLTGATLDR